MAFMTAGEIKDFVIKVFGGALGGWLSEWVVSHPEWFGKLGEWALPVVGVIVGLGAKYLGKRGYIPYELAALGEYAGAVTVGNWIWEKLKKGFGGGASAATSAIIYAPPVERHEEEGAIMA